MNLWKICKAVPIILEYCSGITSLRIWILNLSDSYLEFAGREVAVMVKRFQILTAYIILIFN